MVRYRHFEDNNRFFKFEVFQVSITRNLIKQKQFI